MPDIHIQCTIITMTMVTADLGTTFPHGHLVRYGNNCLWICLTIAILAQGAQVSPPLWEHIKRSAKSDRMADLYDDLLDLLPELDAKSCIKNVRIFTASDLSTPLQQIDVSDSGVDIDLVYCSDHFKLLYNTKWKHASLVQAFLSVRTILKDLEASANSLTDLKEKALMAKSRKAVDICCTASDALVTLGQRYGMNMGNDTTNIIQYTMRGQLGEMIRCARITRDMVDKLSRSSSGSGSHASSSSNY